MKQRPLVSELFDAAAWREIEGFDFADIIYHRAADVGAVRVAFNRPEVRNAFRQCAAAPPSTARETLLRSRACGQGAKWTEQRLSDFSLLQVKA
jgi:hypothetical protein